MNLYIDNYDILKFSSSYIKKIEKIYPTTITSYLTEYYTKNYGTFYHSTKSGKIYTHDYSFSQQPKKKTLSTFSSILIPEPIKTNIYSCLPYDDHFIIKTKITEFNLSPLVKLILKFYINTEDLTPTHITEFYFFLTDTTYEVDDPNILEPIHSILNIIMK